MSIAINNFKFINVFIIHLSNMAVFFKKMNKQLTKYAKNTKKYLLMKIYKLAILFIYDYMPV